MFLEFESKATFITVVDALKRLYSQFQVTLHAMMAILNLQLIDSQVVVDRFGSEREKENLFEFNLQKSGVETDIQPQDTSDRSLQTFYYSTSRNFRQVATDIL